MVPFKVITDATPRMDCAAGNMLCQQAETCEESDCRLSESILQMTHQSTRDVRLPCAWPAKDEHWTRPRAAFQAKDTQHGIVKTSAHRRYRRRHA